MIFNTNINTLRNNSYESTVKNLEKAKEVLDERYAKKQISDEDYAKKSKEIVSQIEKYKAYLNQ